MLILTSFTVGFNNKNVQCYRSLEIPSIQSTPKVGTTCRVLILLPQGYCGCLLLLESGSMGKKTHQRLGQNKRFDLQDHQI